MTEIKENVELKNYSSFKVGGVASLLIIPSSKEELIDCLNKYENAYVFGSCSDLLFSSYGVDEPVILTRDINKFSFNDTFLNVDCGVKGPYISKECEKMSLSGFEFMIGFPGSIGGMIYMNASAHGQSTADCFESCEVYDRDNKQILKLSKSELNFGYRTSILQNDRYILLNATFNLKKSVQYKITELMIRNIEFRKQRQPSMALPNAGSIFKNPENDSAGRLLDLCQLKNFQIGGAKVWNLHANFIINENQATSTDILQLMDIMQTAVFNRYRIQLMPEVKYIGNKETRESEIWEKLCKENTVNLQK